MVIMREEGGISSNNNYYYQHLFYSSVAMEIRMLGVTGLRFDFALK